MKISRVTILVWMLIISCMIGVCQGQCCLKFVSNSKKCAECEEGTHLYRGNCLFNIDRCLKYENGFDCRECEKGYSSSGESCVLLKVKEYQDTLIDTSANDNAAILADYTRSIHQEVENASVIQSVVRTFLNGTQHTIIYYEAKNGKYFQSIASFSLTQVFLFEIVSFKEIRERPQPPSEDEEENKEREKDPIEGKEKKSSENNPSKEENAFQISKINYKYMNYEERKKSDQFQQTNDLIISTNGDTLGEKPIVLAVYGQLRGLTMEYFIYYETTDKKAVYEARTIYQLLRKKVYILSYNKTYLK